MAERWELICHHTYSGIPAVVVDQSPERRSPGIASGLLDGDFLADGRTPGSGSVRFYRPAGRVRIPIGGENLAAWQPLAGVKGEVTFRREAHPAGGVNVDMLVAASAFQLSVRMNALVAWFNAYPAQYAEISSALDPVGAQAYQVPVGAWTTVGFLHDGFDTMELYADGQVVARASGLYAPVNGADTSGVSIGNSQTGGEALHGAIDEVKIWRLNPRRLTEDFFGRPMDDRTAECWRRLQRELAAAFARHPECARELLAGMRDVLDRLRRQARATGPETRQRLEASERVYRQLWRAGAVDGPDMQEVFADLIAWMSLAGVRPERDSGLTALRDSNCLKTIVGELSLPDCDPQATSMLRAIVQRLGQPAAGRPATKA
jgi:hypothetical protein